jgi:hypothetical protein
MFESFTQLKHIFQTTQYEERWQTTVKSNYCSHWTRFSQQTLHTQD